MLKRHRANGIPKYGDPVGATKTKISAIYMEPFGVCASFHKPRLGFLRSLDAKSIAPAAAIWDFTDLAAVQCLAETVNNHGRGVRRITGLWELQRLYCRSTLGVGMIARTTPRF